MQTLAEEISQQPCEVWDEDRNRQVKSQAEISCEASDPVFTPEAEASVQ